VPCAVISILAMASELGAFLFAECCALSGLAWKEGIIDRQLRGVSSHARLGCARVRRGVAKREMNALASAGAKGLAAALRAPRGGGCSAEVVVGQCRRRAGAAALGLERPWPWRRGRQRRSARQ
jgi:hypothetical protein